MTLENCPVPTNNEHKYTDWEKNGGTYWTQFGIGKNKAIYSILFVLILS